MNKTDQLKNNRNKNSKMNKIDQLKINRNKKINKSKKRKRIILKETNKRNN